MSEVSEAEVAAGAIMLCQARNDGLTCPRELMDNCACTVDARAALTAAAQVRERAEHACFADEHLYDHGIGSSDGLGKCFPSAVDSGRSVVGERKGE